MRVRAGDEPLFGADPVPFEVHVPQVWWEDRLEEPIFGPDGRIWQWVDIDIRPMVGFRAPEQAFDPSVVD